MVAPAAIALAGILGKRLKDRRRQRRREREEWLIYEEEEERAASAAAASSSSMRPARGSRPPALRLDASGAEVGGGPLEALMPFPEASQAPSLAPSRVPSLAPSEAPSSPASSTGGVMFADRDSGGRGGPPSTSSESGSPREPAPPTAFERAVEYEEFGLGGARRAKLMELRRLVDADGGLPGDVVIAGYANGTLRRFLESRKWDVGRAHEGVREMLSWRQAHRMESFLDRGEELFSPDELKVLRACCPSSHHGVDKRGFPVHVECSGRYAWNKLFATLDTSMLKDAHLQMMEYQARVLLPWASHLAGRPISKMTNVMDLEGISVSLLKPKVLSLLRAVQDGDEKHYPGMVNVTLLVNAPRTFRVIWGLIKHFYPEGIRDKTVIVPRNPRKRREVFLRYLDEDSIPALFGGGCACTVHSAVTASQFDLSAFFGQHGGAEMEADEEDEDAKGNLFGMGSGKKQPAAERSCCVSGPTGTGRNPSAYQRRMEADIATGNWRRRADRYADMPAHGAVAEDIVLRATTGDLSGTSTPSRGSLDDPVGKRVVRTALRGGLGRGLLFKQPDGDGSETSTSTSVLVEAQASSALKYVLLALCSLTMTLVIRRGGAGLLLASLPS